MAELLATTAGKKEGGCEVLLVFSARFAVIVGLGAKPASLFDIRRCFSAGLWL